MPHGIFFINHSMDPKPTPRGMPPQRLIPHNSVILNIKESSMQSPSSSGPTANRIWPLIGGITLILMGLVFLWQNVTGLELGNWWAALMLLPAGALWARAWLVYRANGGKLTRQILWLIFGGLMPCLVAIVFVLNLDWDKVWPVMLVAAGVVALLNSFIPHEA